MVLSLKSFSFDLVQKEELCLPPRPPHRAVLRGTREESGQLCLRNLPAIAFEPLLALQA